MRDRRTCPGCGAASERSGRVETQRGAIPVCARCETRFAAMSGVKRAAFLIRARGALDARNGGGLGMHAHEKTDDRAAALRDEREGRRRPASSY